MTGKITQINIKYVLIYFGIQQQSKRWKNKERNVSSYLWVIDIKVPYKHVEVPPKMETFIISWKIMAFYDPTKVSDIRL